MKENSLGILSIATNGYIEYWFNLIDSFLEIPTFSENEITFHLFTNSVKEVEFRLLEKPRAVSINLYEIPNYGWPEATLLRYKIYSEKLDLIRENIHPSKIFVTGNTTFEVMRAFGSQIDSSEILTLLGLNKRAYILVTAHRSENVDNPKILSQILIALERLSERFQMEVLYPMHPRTRSKLPNTGSLKGVKIIDPLGFYDFNKLLKNAFCILSDSGTAAEEGLFYQVPNVSLRMATERPETLESGGTIVSGMDVNNIVESVVTAVSMPWSGYYDLQERTSPSAVVINALRTQITNHF